MDLELTIAQQGVQTGYAIFCIYDPLALSVVIDSKSVALPISNTEVVAFTNLENMTYVVRTYLSPTTSYADGTPIGSDFYAYPGNSSTAVIKDDLFLVADQTDGFTSGGTAYNSPELTDWDYSVELKGVGTLQPNIDINILSSGGFEWINGYTIQPGEIYILHFKPNITTSSTPQTGGGANGVIYTGSATISANASLDSSYMGKIIRVSNACTINLPPFDSVPNLKMITFRTGALTGMVTITGDVTIGEMMGVFSNTIYMGRYESITLTKDGIYWVATNLRGNFDCVGELYYSQIGLPVASYSVGSNPNVTLCDGGLRSRDQYPRLWKYVQSIDNFLVSEGDWRKYTDSGDGSIIERVYPNVGKFSSGDGSTTFRMPLLMFTKDGSGNMVSSGFLKSIGTPMANIITGISGDSNIGRNQTDSVGNFFADIQGVKIWKSGKSNYIVALDTINDPNQGNVSVLNRTFRGKKYTGNGNYAYTNETRPSNIGIYILMKC